MNITSDHRFLTMTRRAEWLRQAGVALGIRTELHFTLTLAHGVQLTAQARLPDLGAPSGMLVFLSISQIREHVKALAAAGYGYSVLDEPPEDELMDLEAIREMYVDWGWSGDQDRKPVWML